jgi:hypothetical protein
MSAKDVIEKKRQEMAETQLSGTMTDSEKKSELRRQMEEIDRLERKTGPSGATPLTPKAQMLDASDVQKQHKGKRVRWVNVAQAEKAEGRRHEGYERIPAAEGGKQVGNLALFAIPEGAYQEKIARQRKTNRDRLQAHNREVEQQAEAVARELRDRYGINANILIKE